MNCEKCPIGKAEIRVGNGITEPPYLTLIRCPFDEAYYKNPERVCDHEEERAKTLGKVFDDILVENTERKAQMRESKKDYYLSIAKAVSRRSTCLRRQYGAIIVKDDVIVSTGYNGAAREEKNCCDEGVCWREAHGIPHGEQYEKCRAVHAEANAIISAAGPQMIGATLYLAGYENGQVIDAVPCEMCARLIKNARIAAVIGTEGSQI